MRDDEVLDALWTLARRCVGTSDALAVAVELDRLSALCGAAAGVLVREAVAQRRAGWPAVGRAFGVSRQAAAKRFG
jgi:hypothetical protein